MNVQSKGSIFINPAILHRLQSSAPCLVHWGLPNAYLGFFCGQALPVHLRLTYIQGEIRKNTLSYIIGGHNRGCGSLQSRSPLLLHLNTRFSPSLLIHSLRILWRVFLRGNLGCAEFQHEYSSSNILPRADDDSFLKWIYFNVDLTITMFSVRNSAQVYFSSNNPYNNYLQLNTTTLPQILWKKNLKCTLVCCMFYFFISVLIRF